MSNDDRRTVTGQLSNVLGKYEIKWRFEQGPNLEEAADVVEIHVVSDVTDFKMDLSVAFDDDDFNGLEVYTSDDEWIVNEDDFGFSASDNVELVNAMDAYIAKLVQEAMQDEVADGWAADHRDDDEEESEDSDDDEDEDDEEDDDDEEEKPSEAPAVAAYKVGEIINEDEEEWVGTSAGQVNLNDYHAVRAYWSKIKDDDQIKRGYRGEYDRVRMRALGIRDAE